MNSGEFENVFEIKFDELMLTPDPLDEYHRLVFLYLLVNDSLKLLVDNGYTIDIEKVALNVMACLPGSKNSAAAVANLERIDCLKYQLPNIIFTEPRKATRSSFDLCLANLPKICDERLALRKSKSDDSNSPFFKSIKILSTVISDKLNNRHQTQVTCCSTKSIRLYVQDEYSISSCDAKLDNDELIDDKKFIEFDSDLVWSKNFNLVCLTSIWRSYETLMKSFIKLKRKSRQLKSYSKYFSLYRKEFSFVKYMLYREDHERQANRQLESSRKFCLSHPQVCGTGEMQTVAQNQMTAVAAQLKKKKIKFASSDSSTIENYKSYRGIVEPKIISTNVESIDKTHKLITKNLVDKVSNLEHGLTDKWLPYALCRKLCLKFCFPIRYFLIPIFGKQFPQDCATIYFKQKKTIQKKLVAKMKKVRNKKTKYQPTKLSSIKTSTKNVTISVKNKYSLFCSHKHMKIQSENLSKLQPKKSSVNYVMSNLRYSELSADYPTKSSIKPDHLPTLKEDDTEILNAT